MTEIPTESQPHRGDLGTELMGIVRDRLGSDSYIENLSATAAGHAGLTFLLNVRNRSSQRETKLILKRSAPGVAIQGANNVVRQVPLLKKLASHGVPVPEIMWWDETGVEIGSPYIVMSFVPGREQFPLGTATENTDRGPGKTVFSQSLDILEDINKIPCSDPFSDGTTGLAPSELVQKWEATLRKSPDAGWTKLGLVAMSALAECAPKSREQVICHGDFQSANWLVHNKAISAVIDWDMATIGSPLEDLAWLLMWLDSDCWSDQWTMRWTGSINDLALGMCERFNVRPDEMNWYRALASYKFASIACLSVHLHRSGKRRDNVWEKFALDIPYLFNRCINLLSWSL